MQFFSTLSVALLAATASAFEHRAHARLHGRRDIGYAGVNSSSSAVPTTTLAPTGYVTPAEPTALKPGEEVVTEIVDSTLTYTLGYGSTAQVVTTTVQHTSTRTITHTLVLTRAPTATGTAGDIVDKEVVDGNGEPSTTIRQTSTVTKIVTVYPAHPTASENAASPTGAGCAGASTVFVTEQETVYVTIGADQAAKTPSVIKEAVPTPAHSELPIQSSSGGYYPTGGEDSGAAIPTGVVPTGFPAPYRFRNRK